MKGDISMTDKFEETIKQNAYAVPIDAKIQEALECEQVVSIDVVLKAHAHDVGERNKKLQKIINEMPTYDKDLDDVGGMYPIPVQLFGQALDNWKKKLVEVLKE